MGWTWYIDVDMVFFIFLPFLILIYIKNWKLAYSIYILLILINIGFVFSITMIKHIGTSMT